MTTTNQTNQNRGVAYLLARAAKDPQIRGLLLRIHDCEDAVLANQLVWRDLADRAYVRIQGRPAYRDDDVIEAARRTYDAGSR